VQPALVMRGIQMLLHPARACADTGIDNLQEKLGRSLNGPPQMWHTLEA
jgi:hypothetical protein